MSDREEVIKSLNQRLIMKRPLRLCPNCEKPLKVSNVLYCFECGWRDSCCG